MPLSIDELRALGRQRSGGVALGDSQAAVLGALHAHAFLEAHCCPSQALVAAEAGLSREWVNHVCRELHALGLVCWAKARRLGSRWDHNVYALRHWSRPPRARLLALVDDVRRRVRRGVPGAPAPSLHTEGTTTAAPRTRQALEAPGDGLEPCERARPPDAGPGGCEPTFDEVPW